VNLVKRQRFLVLCSDKNTWYLLGSPRYPLSHQGVLTSRPLQHHRLSTLSNCIPSGPEALAQILNSAPPPCSFGRKILLPGFTHYLTVRPGLTLGPAEIHSLPNGASRRVKHAALTPRTSKKKKEWVRKLGQSDILTQFSDPATPKYTLEGVHCSLLKKLLEKNV